MLCFVIPPHYPTLQHNSTAHNEHTWLVLGKMRKRITDMWKKPLDTSNQMEERWRNQSQLTAINGWKTARNIGFHTALQTGFELVLIQPSEASKKQPDCNFYFKLKNGEHNYLPNDPKSFMEKELGVSCLFTQATTRLQKMSKQWVAEHTNSYCFFPASDKCVFFFF